MGFEGTKGRGKTPYLRPSFFTPTLFRKIHETQSSQWYLMWVPHSHGHPEEECLARLPGARKGCPTTNGGGALLRPCRLLPAHLPVGLQPGWIHLQFRPFLPLLLRVVSSWGPSQPRLIFCLNHMDKPSANKSPVLMTPFL